MLEALQVLHKGAIEQTIEVANRASPDIEDRDRQKYLLGEMTLMMLEKARKYDMPVPPELERAEASELQHCDHMH